MKCNVCEAGDMEYNFILSKEEEETVVVPEEGSNLYKMVVNTAIKEGESEFKGFKISHMWNCTDCPNSQVEWYDREDGFAYAKAMGGYKRKDL